MAKPGSRRARDVARGRGNGAVDLSVAAMPDSAAQGAQERIELATGMRCSGCGKRIGLGLQFTSIDPRDEKAPVMKLAACNRPECNFAEQARAGATLMEMVEFVWLDANGVDAPPAKIIRKAREAAQGAASDPP